VVVQAELDQIQSVLAFRAIWDKVLPFLASIRSFRMQATQTLMFHAASHQYAGYLRSILKAIEPEFPTFQQEKVNSVATVFISCVRCRWLHWATRFLFRFVVIRTDAEPHKFPKSVPRTVIHI
jgi:hypothetical protein